MEVIVKNHLNETYTFTVIKSRWLDFPQELNLDEKEWKQFLEVSEFLIGKEGFHHSENNKFASNEYFVRLAENSLEDLISMSECILENFKGDYLNIIRDEEFVDFLNDNKLLYEFIMNVRTEQNLHTFIKTELLTAENIFIHCLFDMEGLTTIALPVANTKHARQKLNHDIIKKMAFTKGQIKWKYHQYTVMNSSKSHEFIDLMRKFSQDLKEVVHETLKI